VHSINLSWLVIHLVMLMSGNDAYLFHIKFTLTKIDEELK